MLCPFTLVSGLIMDIVYGLGLGVVMYWHGFGILASCCIYLVLVIWICTSILALFFYIMGRYCFWMVKLNFLLACRQIFLLYIGLYWVTIELGISHHNAAPRVLGAWNPGARQLCCHNFFRI